jgi:hypothetical protein
MIKIAQVDIGFVGGDTWVDNVIKFFSNSYEENITHSFAIVYGRPFEAEGIKEPNTRYPGAWFTPNRYKYYDEKFKGLVKYIRVEVPYLEAFEDKAVELQGTLYGYSDCLATEYKKLTGEDALVDGETTVMCSETVSLLLRAGGLNILPELQPDQIMPVVLYHELVNNFNGQDVTNEYVKEV